MRGEIWPLVQPLPEPMTTWSIAFLGTNYPLRIYVRVRVRVCVCVLSTWIVLAMGLLPDTCGLRKRRECRERFPRHRVQRTPLISDSGTHHGRCVTHVPRVVMHVEIANPWWRAKRFRHSRCMRNPQFNVSGKRPMYCMFPGFQQNAHRVPLTNWKYGMDK